MKTLTDILHCVCVLSLINCVASLGCENLQMPASCECSTELGVRIVCTQQTQVPTIGGSDTYNGLIYEFDLANNNIHTIPENAFQGLRIQRINLMNTKLNNISDKAFLGQEDYLTELKLSADNSEFVLPPYNAIKNLTNLTLLHMSGFRVALDNNLEGTGLFTFANLEELQLQDMNIFHIGSDVFNLPNLKILRLINNLFESLPTITLHHTQTNLEHLVITGNKIIDIPFYYFQQNNKVKFFDASRNNISVLEDKCFFGVTDVLETLILNQNPLSSVAKLDRIQNLSALIQLRLGNIGLREIPHNPVFLRNKFKLQDVYLNGNMLTSLSGDIFSSTGYKIKKLDLSHNQLHSLTNDFFQNLTSLTYLLLNSQTSGGNLVLPSFSSLTSLENLNLEQTRLDTDQAWNEIKHLRNLVSLNLDSTGLTDIQDFVFQNIQNLYELSLHDNNIAEVNQTSFVGLKDSLQYLYLSKNDITTMDECIFHNFTKKIHMSLTDNPLHCDCHFIWLKRSLNESKIEFVTNMEECSTPGNNANKLFTSIPVNDFLCDLHRNEPICPNYYLPSTTNSPLTSEQPTTGTPTPPVHLSFNITDKSFETITISFNAEPIELVKEFIIDLTNLKTLEVRRYKFHPSPTAQTHPLFGLTAITNYEVCLRVKKVDNIFQSECFPVTTLVDPQSTTQSLPIKAAQNDTGIIIGAVIGGIVLFVLLAAILYLVVFKRRTNSKDIHSSPVKPVASRHLPTIGYDSKRFKKNKKQNGTPTIASNDNETNGNIQVAVITDGQNNQPNLGRISAGSYQYLDKDHKPRVNPKPLSGEYANSNEMRPLPTTPRKNHSYQNEAFQRSPTSDTEPHTYYEIHNV